MKLSSLMSFVVVVVVLLEVVVDNFEDALLWVFVRVGFGMFFFGIIGVMEWSELGVSGRTRSRFGGTLGRERQ